MPKTDTVWERRAGQCLAKGRLAQCLGPGAPHFLRILPGFPGDLTDRMGNASKEWVPHGTSSRILCSANVLISGKTEGLVCEASLWSICPYPLCGCPCEAHPWLCLTCLDIFPLVLHGSSSPSEASTLLIKETQLVRDRAKRRFHKASRPHSRACTFQAVGRRRSRKHLT